MKRATVTTYVVHIQCPYCDEGISEPLTGSMMWDTSDMSAAQVVFCEMCKRSSQLPVRVPASKI